MAIIQARRRGKKNLCVKINRSGHQGLPDTSTGFISIFIRLIYIFIFSFCNFLQRYVLVRNSALPFAF